MLHLQKATLQDIKSLFATRKLYIRCGDMRIEATKTSFLKSVKTLSDTKLSFEFISTEKTICIESITQLN